MDLTEAVRDLAARSETARSTALTEEATKTAVVMPTLRALGWDVFDLSQVVPEFIADVGLKKGEKVDYALKISDEVVALIEAKPISKNLGDVQYSQLFRYFSVTSARVAVLTNGIQFWFFTDIDESNKMDRRPFFKFNLSSYTDNDIQELAHFHRDQFNLDTILISASSLKRVNAATAYLKAQANKPDDEFIKFVGRQIYHNGNITKSVLEDLRKPIQTAFDELIRNRIQEKLGVTFSQASMEKEDSDPAPEDEPEIISKVTTTDDEMLACCIIQAISSEYIEPQRVTIRDAKSYCGIFIDNNNRKPVCRLYFNAASVRYVGCFDANKTETKHTITSLSDIYQHKVAIREAVRTYA